MRSSPNTRSLVAACVVALCPVMASAAVVADYQADFTPAGPAKAGWSYLWNANGPLGNPATYVSLVRDTSGNFETQANGTYPDAAPGAGLAATPSSVIPGLGSTQAADQLERYVITAYTFSAADIAANGNTAILDNYRFAVPESSVDGITASIFLNSTPLISITLPPGIDYNSSLPDAYPVPLGNLSAGDTLYVAIGSRMTDTGDRLDLAYRITLVPEPGAMMLAGVVTTGLGLRRRRGR